MMDARTLRILGMGTVLLVGACARDGSHPPETTGHAVRAPWSPDNVSPVAFQRIADIRELRGGAVLVLDDIEPTVVLLDSLLRFVRFISRVGQGPGEFARPAQFIGLTGNSTLAIDLVPGRSILIDGYGHSQTVGRLSEVLVCPESSEETWIHSIRVLGADTLGNLYIAEGSAQDHTRGHTKAGNSTLAIWTPACERELLGVLRSVHEGPDLLVRLAADVPFEATSSDAVLPGGGLLVVHARPFMMELFPGPDESPSTIKLVYNPVPLSKAHMAWWRGEFMRPTAGLVMRSDGLRRGKVFHLSYSDPAEWPPVLPPILPNALTVDRSGFAWLLRTTDDLWEPFFDVLDPTAGRIDSVTLPRGTRLVGHGSGALYTARADPDGFEYLERRRTSRGRELWRQPD